jgi:aspartyl-tRNA(Asn)/glutamyl-tRNA(Gln) amidotransferase subunit B
MYNTGDAPDAIVEAKGWKQISDTGELETLIARILEENPGPVSEYRSGKKKAKGFLMGRIMQATQGKGNPQLVNELLETALTKE